MLSPSPLTPAPHELARMKRIALGLLALAAAIYGVAELLLDRHPAWGYVGAFAEAAMVGAIADWFAVVALFRRPLGLPIPHTAIIPSNKDRIGENLATFICANFLSDEQVLAKLRQFDPAARLARWLADPQHADRLAGHLVAALHYGFGVLDDERVRSFFRATLVARLEAVDITRLTGRILDVLTSEGRHQQLLDGILRQLAGILEDETIKREVAEVIAAEVKYLRVVGLDTVAGRYATEKIVAGVVRLVADMGADATHPLRLRFDEFMTSFIERLKADPEVHAKGETIKAELLAHPALTIYLQGLWSDLVAWFQTDLARDDSLLRAQLLIGTRSLGDKLRDDAAMQAWINEQLETAAPRWIERYREDIRAYIVARVADWNAEEMTRELERNIGRDLQFIRINGTLVGGMVGLAIHAATQWVRAMGSP